jgi:hypothetical protein
MLQVKGARKARRPLRLLRLSFSLVGHHGIVIIIVCREEGGGDRG